MYAGSVQGAVYGWKYRMVARSALNTRSASRQVEGFLIRAHGGYGCVQPWPMFGHADLPDHWAALAGGKSLPLLDQALACAQQDGVARSAGKSWWTGCPVPASHATVTDLETQEDAAIAAGFAIWKLKVSLDDARTVAELLERRPFLRLRLDFNEVPHEEQMQHWGREWPQEYWRRIDFLEDPFPYEAEAWRRFSLQRAVPLAVDRALTDSAFSGGNVAVWKPAWMPLPRGISAETVVVTSAMDHPVGQAWAALQAAAIRCPGICGLRTDQLFENDPFTSRMGAWSPEWPAPAGTGMGFDDLLDNLPWARIR